jgi:NOL1/NOP2/fmu family ribosome biogenesis protein
VKPTTRLVQAFGHAATKARIEIRDSELSALLAGKEVSLSLGGISKGYVILALRGGGILGLGFYTENGIRSQLPKKEVDGLAQGEFILESM